MTLLSTINTMSDSDKEKFLSVSAESIFGIRWIKTPRAKIITGVIMVCLGVVSLLDVPGSGILVTLLIAGGGWYLYKGLKGRS